MPERSKCGSCGAEIIFVRSAKTGNYNPLDAEPVPGGNIAIIDGVFHVIGDDLFSQTVPAGERFQWHVVTCPNAQKYRKAKEATKDKGKGKRP